jgi:hypothetical protein
MTQRKNRDDPEQSKLFIKKARELKADEANSASDALLKRLATRPPKPRKTKPSR